MFWAKTATAAIVVKFGGCRPVYILKNTQNLKSTFFPMFQTEVI